MPRYIQIRGVGAWLEEIDDQEDADYAVDTLGEVLAKLTSEIRGLRVAARFFTEEYEERTIAYAHGEPCAGRPEDAPPSDTHRERRKIAPTYAAYLAAEADATRARSADDAPSMLALLDDPRLGSPLAPPLASEARHPAFRARQVDNTRRDLWGRLLAKPRDLTLERVLRAFAEETESVAHIITYKLYTQTHFVTELASRSPSDNPLIEERVEQAISEWPDFPRPKQPRTPPKKSRTLADQINHVLDLLAASQPNGGNDKGGLDKLRAMLAREDDNATLAEARAHAGPRLSLLLTSDDLFARSLAVELLFALKVSPSELAPYIAGLPETDPMATIAAEIRASTAAPQAAIAEPMLPRASEHLDVILGVICDVSAIEDPGHAAMLVAECRALPQTRAGAINWLADIAKAFPKGTVEYVEESRGVYVARRGQIDWSSAAKSNADAIIARDLRRSTDPLPLLPPEYLAFAAQRRVTEEGLAANEPAETSWENVAHPALTAKRGPLKKLGEAARLFFYERLAKAPRKVPAALALSAILHEPRIGFRITGALRSRSDLKHAFGALLRDEHSPVAREALRDILGYAADDFETRALPTAPSPVKDAPLAIADMVDDALARAAVSTLGAPSSGKRTPRENAAFKEADAEAHEASNSGELGALLAALDLPALAGERGNALRTMLWKGQGGFKGILSVKRASLPFARVVRAFGEEADVVVRGIAYKLYIQKQLETPLLEAATEAFSRGPAAERLLSRLAYAAREWPDFTIPESTPSELARRLRA